MRVDAPGNEVGNTKQKDEMGNGHITTTSDLVHCLETADCLHLARQVDACQLLFPEQKFTSRKLAGGIAGATFAGLGRRMNVVTGLGTKESVMDEDLKMIEKIYTDVGLSPTIDLCPFANERTLESLTSHGYHTMSFWNTHVRSLGDIGVDDTIETKFPGFKSKQGITICQAQPDEHEAFVQASVEGFKSIGRPTETLATFARIATKRSDSLLYLVRIDGEIAATAAAALIDTGNEKVAYLYIGSTIPKYRGRGLHQLLNWARIIDARKNGCSLAQVSTGMSVASGRNAERVGFRVAYTKSWLRKAGTGGGG